MVGIETYDQPVALAPLDFVRRWLEADDPRLEIVRRLRAPGRDVPAAFLAAPPLLP